MTTSMGDIASRLAAVEERLTAACARAGRRRTDVTLVAVSKFQPAAAIEAAVEAGATAFGENYVQELRAKQDALTTLDVEWHFIGSLQRNKAKDVVGRVALVHSVDSLALAGALSKRAAGVNATVDVLVEVNAAGEVSKGGVRHDAVTRLVDDVRALPALRCRGLMTMPPPADDAEASRPHFRALARLARTLDLPQLSMGMTGDFEVAVEEGATIVRVGTAIFGARPPR